MTCDSNVCGTGGYTGPQPGDPDNNVAISASPAFGGIDVTWTYPGINPQAVAHVMLFRAIAPDFSLAIQIAVVGGNFYYDKLDTGTTYYYWLRIVSVNGTVGDPVGPASATARPLIADLIEQLTGQIDSGVLAGSLRSTLDQISMVNADLAQEILDRQGGETSFATALLDVQNGVAEAHTFIANEIASRIDADGVIAEQIDLVAATFNDQIAAVTIRADAWIGPHATLDGKVSDIGALYTAQVTVNGLVGGFGVYNDGSSVEAGFDVDTFWVGRTSADKVKPFIVVGSETFIDQAVINQLTFSKLTDEVGSFIVADGQVKADYIDTKGLVIRDTLGNPVFSAGLGLDHSYVNGLGAMATANYAQIGSTVRFADGSVMGTANFVNALSKIGAANISTFMDAAAIGSAYIGNAAIGSAHIQDLTVDTIKITNNAVTQPVSAYTAALSTTAVLQTLAISTTGSPVVVSGGVVFKNTNGAPITGSIALKCDGTTLVSMSVYIPAWDGVNSYDQAVNFPPFKDNPSAGSHTYTIESVSLSSINCYARGLFAMEVKK